MSEDEKRLKIDCGKLPSEKNCQVVITAPERQKEDLIDAGVAHAVKAHGHEDTPELREDTAQLVEPA